MWLRRDSALPSICPSPFRGRLGGGTPEKESHPMVFLPQEVIARKRDGKTLGADEIASFMAGFSKGSVSHAQAAAFAMAVYFQDMSMPERVALTLAMRDSGDVLDWSDLDGPVADKHSTGGVGDNVSLMLAPIIAACGGFNPMKSVWKTDAFTMARWRNGAADFRISNPIPEAIITRPPSAELAEDQEDSNSLGEYAALDFVLKILVEEFASAKVAATRLEQHFGQDLESMIGDACAEEYANRIARLVRNSQYKRMQSPPGVKLNATDFGAGWRYPIAGRYTL